MYVGQQEKDGRHGNMADIFWKEKLDALNGDVDADGDPKQPSQYRQDDDQSTVDLFVD